MSDGIIRVLHIDDDKGLLRFAKIFIEEADPSLQISSVGTPGKALELLAQEHFDCVVTDYQMSPMDGLELATKIRAETNIPIILYTGQGSEEVAEKAFAVGIDDYIRKEFASSHYKVLARRIRAAVDKQWVEELYSEVVTNSTDGITIFEGTKIVYANKITANYIGVDDPEELIGTDALDWIIEEDREEIESQPAAQGEPSGITQLTFRVRRPDGEIRIIEALNGPITYKGRPARLSFGRDVTERMRMEEELKESEVRFHNLFENMVDGFALHRIVQNEEGEPVDYVFLEANDAFERLTGLNRTEILGKKATEVLPGVEDDPADWIGRYGRIAIFGEVSRFEQYAQPLQRWYSITAYSPKEGFFATIFEDITDRKRLENRIHMSETRLRNFMNAATDFIYLYDPDLTLVDVNEAGMIIFPPGTKVEDVIGKNMLELIPGLEETGRYDKYMEVVETGEPVFIDDVVLHPSVGDIKIAIKAFKVENGLGVLSYNITERKRAEEELREQHRLNQILLDSFPCIALLLRPSTREIVASNAEAVKVGAVPGEHCYATWGQREDPCPWCLAPKLWETGEPQHVVIEALGIVWDAYWIPVGPDLYMHYAFDITERKRMEEEIRRHTELLQDLVEERTKELNEQMVLAQTYLDVAHVIVVALDTEGEILLLNQMGCNTLGYTQDEVMGLNWIDTFIPPRMREDVIRVHKQGIAGEIELAEFYDNPILTKDGEERIIEWHNAFIKDSNGNIVSSISSGIDVTEWSEMQSALAESERMSVAGRLATMVGHDLRRPLQKIKDSITLMKTKPEYTDEMLGVMDEAVGYAANILEDLRLSTRDVAPQRRSTDVNDVITMAMADNSVPEKIDVQVSVDEGLDSALVDPIQMRRVLNNLIKNALDAMPGGGRLSIIAERHGESMNIEVSDTGAGIEEGELPNLFKPFYTTKPKGMGLGLAFCRRAVEAHGGTIAVESEADERTTFTIKIPLHKA